MFLIWGTRRTQRALGRMAYFCAGCRKETAFTAFVIRTTLTVFFIPLIPLRKRHEIACGEYGRRLLVVDALKRQLESWERGGAARDGAAQSA